MSLKYPIGVETFSQIVEENFAYVDKTEVIYRLTQSGRYFFLSRPRRFGKSLMLSTIEAYFEGRRELFDGLWLGNAAGVDWTPRAVIRLNFVDTKADVSDLEASLDYQLGQYERQYRVENISPSFGQRFKAIIEHAAQTSGRGVVVLIDEYDKVLTNTINPPEGNRELREILKPVFAVLKGADRYIHFGLLTGVSRFSKLSIFSDLNNLNDISLDRRFDTICGITEAEMRRHFSQGIQDFADSINIGFEDMIQILKANYDGYHFSENCPDIYNPYSLINALDAQKIVHKWFETGTPTFLVERIKAMDEDLNEVLSPVATGIGLSSMSMMDDNLTAMLYQTGYLTIKEYDADEDVYTLGIPNHEVQNGLYRYLLPLYTGRDRAANESMLIKMRRSVLAGRPDEFLRSLQSFLAAIPPHLSENQHEVYYENNLFLIFKLLGFDVDTEHKTADGRIDTLLTTSKYIYILELKLNGTAAQAMEQIHRKRYALPFETDGRQIIRIGVSFSKQTRNIDEWIIE